MLFAVGPLILLTPALVAQCPNGSTPDELGCPPAINSPQTANSAGALNIEENSSGKTAGSAAENPLGGASYTEGTPKKAEAAKAHETALVKPEPLTDFQRFVAASTGETLPIYGAEFFSSVPLSFSNLDKGPAPTEMIIGADDELRIRVWGQVNFSANVYVSREGEVYLPKVGAVHVSGLRFSEVASHLRNVMDRVYRNYDMSVDVGEIHSIQIYVTGRAHRPGVYTVSALSTLVDATF